MKKEFYRIREKWCILIGIDNYLGSGFSPLRYAVQDVVAVFDLLSTASYEKAQMRLMTDTSTSPLLKPSRNNILREVTAMSKSAGKEDSILLYFSGHGIEQDGLSYLIPADAQDDILTDTAIPLDRIKELLLESKARLKILLLDSCHSGARFGEKGSTPMTTGFLKSLETEAEGWAILSSCRQGQLSWEWDEKAHSVFTYYLIEALSGSADYDNDGIVTVADAGKYVMEQVETWAEKHNKKQTPTFSMTTSGDVDMELARVPAATTPDRSRESERNLSQLIRENGVSFRSFSLPPADIVSYDGIEGINEEIEVMLVPFESQVDVPPSQQHFQNMHFHLRFYFPKHRQKEHRYEVLVVMINGLAEVSPGIYDDLGLEFARHNIPSVLFPLPNHFNRRSEFPCDDHDIYAANSRQDALLTTQEIITDLANEPERIVTGFVQMMSDMSRFMASTSDDKINPQFRKFFKSHFGENARVCLLGYSLGGLMTLALLLKDPKLYDSVFLVESGANFADINAGILFVRNETLARLVWNKYVVAPVSNGSKRIEDVRQHVVFKNDRDDMKKAWDDVVTKVNSGESIEAIEQGDPFFFQHFVRMAKDADDIWEGVVRDIIRAFGEVNMTGSFREIFEKIVIGNNKTLYKDDLGGLCDKILIFLGGIDTVFTMAAIQTFSPEKTGLAIVQLPGLGHWLKYSSREQWLRWKEFITKTIINFRRIQG